MNTPTMPRSSQSSEVMPVAGREDPSSYRPMLMLTSANPDIQRSVFNCLRICCCSILPFIVQSATGARWFPGHAWVACLGLLRRAPWRRLDGLELSDGVADRVPLMVLRPAGSPFGPHIHARIVSSRPDDRKWPRDRRSGRRLDRPVGIAVS